MVASEEGELSAPPEGMKAVALDLTAGSLGGMVGVVIGHPLDVVKTRLQSATCHLRDLSASQCLAETMRKEGWLGLWRGVAPPIFAVGWWQATVFASFEWTFKECKAAGMEEERGRVVAGLVSGAASCLVTVPTDAVKIQLQLERGSSGGAVTDSLRCGRHMVTTYGISSLFRGMSACLWRDIPNVSLYLYAYAKAKEACMSALPEDGGRWPRMIAESVAGGLAGALSWATATPMDVVKTVQQEAACAGRPIGLTRAIGEVYRRDGWRGFLRGLGPIVVRAFPVNALTFLVYEDLKRLMGVPSQL
mmetsp:Transcript_49382/g.127444  ORF Transcript_49382/g.127444 Transcript_49382/m.127444 type:complete len:305 (-) Transcript_49382:130-1044(-)